MHSSKRIVKHIAKNHNIDPDIFLIYLWDQPNAQRFNYIKNENSIIKNKDLKTIKIFIDKKLKKKEDRKPIKKTPIVTKIHVDYDFSTIGKITRPIYYLSKEEVVKIYEELVEDFKKLEDPISPIGIKDEKLLQSALFHPRTSYEDKLKYPTPESSAAALMYSLSHNHAFHNGNKRVAMVSMLVFLDRHNIDLVCSEDELFKLSLNLADHKLVKEEFLCSDAEIHALAYWIYSLKSKEKKKGERSITLKRFKLILQHFGCTFLDNGRIERVVSSRLFGFLNKKLVSRKAFNNTMSEGNEVSKSFVKSVREDLELDSVHNIHSETFYTMSVFSSNEFIVRYKNLLRRLSKV